jgi:hypothetical protein
MCIFLLPVAAAHADDCDVLVKLGFYNVEKVQTTQASSDLAKFHHCQLNFHSLDDKQLANAEVEIFGAGKGSADYSRERRERDLQTWCTNNVRSDNAIRSLTRESRNIYDESVRAFAQCKALGSQDIRIVPEISSDSTYVDIGISYAGSIPEGIQLSGLVFDGFSCATVSPDTGATVQLPTRVKTQSINISCTRESATKRTLGGIEYLVRPSGRISIQTASRPFVIYFSELWDPGLPVREAAAIRSEAKLNEFPVGAVLMSMLPPEIFLSEKNPHYQPGKWVLADGQSPVEKSAYGDLTGNAFAPDLSYVRESLLLGDIISGSLKDKEHVDQLVSLKQTLSRSGKWTWHWTVSGRDNQGNPRYDNEYENDKDWFQNYLDDQGFVVSHGRTWGFKHGGTWGDWKPGEANVFGIATASNPFYYYLKIN